MKYTNIFKEPEFYEDVPTEELPAIIPIKPEAPAPKGTITIQKKKQKKTHPNIYIYKTTCIIITYKSAIHPIITPSLLQSFNVLILMFH